MDAMNKKLACFISWFKRDSVKPSNEKENKKE